MTPNDNTAGNNLTTFVSIVSMWKFLSLKSYYYSNVLYDQIVITRAEFDNRHSNLLYVY